MSHPPTRPAPSDLFSLAGRAALVTGAGRGLGFEIARAFAGAGAHVYISGRNSAATEAAAAGLREEGLDVEALVFAVEDEAGAAAALDQISAARRRLDILVNNVGARLRAPIEEIDAAAFRHMLDVDLTAAYTLSRAAVAHMGKGGRIIMMSSIQGLFGRRGDVAYITAKGGMIALTRALACEFSPTGVTCNAIAAGGFLTETNRAHMNQPHIQERVRERAPLGRYGEPHEIAGAAVFLASPAASFVTGSVLVVDGGWSAAI